MLFDVRVVLFLFLRVVGLLLLEGVPELEPVLAARHEVERKNRMGSGNHAKRHAKHGDAARRSGQRDQDLARFAIARKPRGFKRKQGHDRAGEIQRPGACQNRRVDFPVNDVAEHDHDPLVDRKAGHHVQHESAVRVRLVFLEHHERDPAIRHEQDKQHDTGEFIAFQIFEKLSARDLLPAVVAVDVAEQIKANHCQHEIVKRDCHQPFGMVHQSGEQIEARVGGRDDHVEIQRNENPDIDVVNEHRRVLVAVEKHEHAANHFRGRARENRQGIHKKSPGERHKRSKAIGQRHEHDRDQRAGQNPPHRWKYDFASPMFLFFHLSSVRFPFSFLYTNPKKNSTLFSLFPFL